MITAEQLYEVWRESPSLHWNEIVHPMNPTPLGEIDQTGIFVARWNRLAEWVNARATGS